MAGGGWLLHIQGNIGDGGVALLCGVHSMFSPDSYRLCIYGSGSTLEAVIMPVLGSKC